MSESAPSELASRVDRLGGRTFDLACRLHDGVVASDEAAREGEVLLAAGRALLPAVKALAAAEPGEAAQLQALLRDALIEAQFAVEGGTAPMRSRRLDDYIAVRT